MSPINGRVSIVIPTWNSAQFLERCLGSITEQTYKDIETIVVDGFSTDGCAALAEPLADRVLMFKREGEQGRLFGATAQRNEGARQATGEFIYYVDVDMILGPKVVEACVRAVRDGAAAVIVPEDSFGEGYWAQCKKLERRCYWNDDLIEAPRFVSSKAWSELGGLDESISGGGDDWDLTQRLRLGNYTIGRIDEMVLHDEGHLKLNRLMKKRFRYGKEVMPYLKAHRGHAIKQYVGRTSYLRHTRMFLKNPKFLPGFIFMRGVEYGSGFAGMMFSLASRKDPATRVPKNVQEQS